MNLIEAWKINANQAFIKFEPSIKVSTLTNARFVLQDGSATPSLVSSNPFETIAVSTDYDSISKIVTLNWRAGVLAPNTAYRLMLTGFRSASNVLIEDDSISFTSDTSTDPGPVDPVPPAPSVSVIDHTIITSDMVSLSEVYSGIEGGFTVIEAEPANGDYYLEHDFNKGRIIIKFSKRPSLSSLTEDLVRVQRKAIQQAPIRWETVYPRLSLDSARPWMYVDMPSEDATPIYNEYDKTYFAENYKYRIIISKNFTTS